MCNCASKTLSDDILLDFAGASDQCEALSAALKASMKVNTSTGKTEFSARAWEAFKNGCPTAMAFFGGQVPPLYNDIPAGNIVVTKDNGDIVVVGHRNPISQLIGIAAGVGTGVYIYKHRKGKKKGKKVMPVVVGLLTSGAVAEGVGYGMQKFKKK